MAVRDNRRRSRNDHLEKQSIEERELERASDNTVAPGVGRRLPSYPHFRPAGNRKLEIGRIMWVQIPGFEQLRNRARPAVVVNKSS